MAKALPAVVTCPVTKRVAAVTANKAPANFLSITPPFKREGSPIDLNGEPSNTNLIALVADLHHLFLLERQAELEPLLQVELLALRVLWLRIYAGKHNYQPKPQHRKQRIEVFRFS